MAKRVGVDKWIFFTTLILVSIGLAMVFSASAVASAVTGRRNEARRIETSVIRMSLEGATDIPDSPP